jgi:outer membrane biosynthesis protein TonB
MNLRFLVLSGVAVGCLALAAPAQAKTCPSGQILRVSKNTCMDKGEAVKLGILRGGAGKATSAAKTQKAAIAKVETDEDDAPKTKAKPKSGPRPDKTARAAPEKPVDEARPARAVAPPKAEPRPVDKSVDKSADKAVEAPEPAGKNKSVRVIPMSASAVAPAPAPAPAAAQLAPIDPPKTLTPSPFGSLGAGSFGAAPAHAGAPAGRK